MAGSSNHRSSIGATIVCAVLIAIFGATCYLAVMSKSATHDEPLHALGGYVHVFLHDYRVNPEDPPLWNYWFMLPHHAGKLTIPADSIYWNGMLDSSMWGNPWAGVVLFTKENDGARFIDASRTLMVLLAMALGAVIAFWSWRVAGAASAIVATFLFAFDPNLLGHGGLVKNDVPITLLLTAMCFALWFCTRRATVFNILLASILLGAGLNTKFSGVLFVPIFAAILFFRAVLNDDWIVLGKTLSRRTSRVMTALCVFTFAGILAWGMTWMSYGFRFAPTPSGALFNMQGMVDETAKSRARMHHPYGFEPTTQEIEATSPGAVAHAVVWLADHRVLPQAWLYGFLYTYQSAIVRDAYLLGRHSMTGFWYYFPLAMFFKTAVATELAIALVVIWLIASKSIHSITIKKFAPLWIPFAIYGFTALTSNLNLGVRHVLPLYPFIYVAIGVIASKMLRAHPKVFKLVAPILALGLAIESLATFPNYISFFNVAVGGSRAGEHLLSDSNIDWGQDLPLLAQWQREHHPQRLYFCSSGTCDPIAYGVDSIAMPGGWDAHSVTQYPDKPGVIAISVMRLHGLNITPQQRAWYENFERTHKPFEVLGGSIYLYKFDGT